jgi:hypothetical protein
MIRTNFALMQFHGYDLAVLENMMPWERAVYIELLMLYIQEENQKANMRRINAQTGG